MNGRGGNARVRARRDRVLAVLFEADRPLTHGEVSDRAGGRCKLDGAIYNDLRQLCGDRTMRYTEQPKDGRINAPGYPVIWNSWLAREGAYVTFELTADARAELAAAYDGTDLEAMFAAPAHTREPR